MLTPTKWKAVCFGPSEKFALAASKRFEITGIVNEDGRFNQALYDFSMLSNINYHAVSSDKEFKNLVWEGDLGVSFGFGKIFNQVQIRGFKRGIWNIHPGKLPNYRGRHTVGWALINGDHDLTVSLHAINDEIDQGMLLAEETIKLSQLESQTEVETAIEKIACGELLDKGIIAELDNKKTAISNGPYLPPLTDKWNILDPNNVDGVLLYRIMKTKKNYGGIIIGNKRYKDCYFVHEGARETYKGGDFFICKDKVEVYLT